MPRAATELTTACFGKCVTLTCTWVVASRAVQRDPKLPSGSGSFRVKCRAAVRV